MEGAHMERTPRSSAGSTCAKNTSRYQHPPGAAEATRQRSILQRRTQVSGSCTQEGPAYSPALTTVQPTPACGDGAESMALSGSALSGRVHPQWATPLAPEQEQEQ